jgi:hypothetical protein
VQSKAKKERFFIKSAQKLFVICARAAESPEAQSIESFLVLFFQKRTSSSLSILASLTRQADYIGCSTN